MAPNITISNESFEKLSNRLKNQSFSFGILIGQCSDGGNKDIHILHWCPTVYPEGEKQPTSLQDLDCNLVADHATQVSRMLPGGVSVLGVYLSSPSPGKASDSAEKAKLQGVVSALYRDSVKPFVSALGIAAPEHLTKMIVVTICSSSLKHSCLQFSCTSVNALPQTCSLEVGRKGLEGVRLSYRYCLDLSACAAPCAKKDGNHLIDMLLEPLRPWAQRVMRSPLVVGGALWRPDDTAAMAAKLTKGQDPVPCRLLEPSTEQTASNPGTSEGTGLQLSGSIAGEAFIGKSCSVGFAVRAVQEDICRSVYVRSVLHCDSLLEEASVPAVLHELPRRVFISGQDIPMTVYDYLFPGDVAEDACESVNNFFNIDVSAEDVNCDVETVPNIEALHLEGLSQTCSTSSSKHSLSFRPVHLQAAALFVLLSILFAYLYVKK